MELEAMQQLWISQDKKLDTSLRLNQKLLRSIGLEKSRSAVQRLSRASLLEFLFSALAVVFLGNFIFEHRAEPAFWLPALFLDACAIFLLQYEIRQWILVKELDYAGPILNLQKKLEIFRVRQLWVTKWTLLMAPLLWLPAFIVLLQGLLGVSLYGLVSELWIASNLLFGVLFLLLGGWLCRKYAYRWEKVSWMRSFMQDMAGQHLEAARQSLAELEELGREERLR